MRLLIDSTLAEHENMFAVSDSINDTVHHLSGDELIAYITDYVATIGEWKETLLVKLLTDEQIVALIIEGCKQLMASDWTAKVITEYVSVSVSTLTAGGQHALTIVAKIAETAPFLAPYLQ